MSHHVVIYTRPGCHLCEIAEQLVLGMQNEFALTIEKVNIDTGPWLKQHYGDKIPVVVIDERTVFAAPIRSADLRLAFRRPA